jgi:hypothetical protein
MTSINEMITISVQTAITKMAKIRWLINNRNLILTDLSAAIFKIKTLADSVTSEDLFPGS